MSCYGSNIIRIYTEMGIIDDQCCESCNDVIKKYQALGWHFDTKHFSQCLGDFLWILAGKIFVCIFYTMHIGCNAKKDESVLNVLSGPGLIS